MSAAPYFERSAPIGLIFGSFFVVFLPLCVLSVVPNFVSWLPYAVLLQAVGLGTTHFFITLAVYFRRDELAYFASSPRNRLVFFGVPAALLVLFALFAATELRTQQPVLAAYLFGGLRFFDFFHVGRQSFGMLQIWRRPAASEAAPWWRRAENAFFVGMAILQWETFVLGGRLRMDALHMAVPAAALFVLFGTILTSYLQRARQTGRAGARALAYFVMQAGSAAAAAYDTRLYLIALTLHYVEYHVIMAPRLLGESRLSGPASSRWPAQLRPWLVYPVLVAVVVAFELRNAVSGVTPTTAFFVHIFDGIFFVHYFVEAFLWKFGSPHYRQTLAPLYFAPVADAAEPEPKRRWLAPLLAGAVLGAALLFVSSRGGLAGLGAAFEKHVTGPMHAENHTRWGLALAREGKLDEARAHLQEAVARSPQSPQARALLGAVDRELERRSQP